MLYAVRTLFMPSCEQLSSKAVAVIDGRVEGIVDFTAEVHSMVFVEEAYIAGSSSCSSVKDIKKEAHCADGPLYIYSADDCGNLRLLL